MGLHLRLSLPDRPGALARVTQAIALAGADVIHVNVLESQAGRAVDDFRLRWSGREDTELIAAVSACPGVRVVACRRTRWLHDGRPDLDLLTYLLAAPQRGIETLVDMAPAALDADWAELRSPVAKTPVLYGTEHPPRDDVSPVEMPIRATASMHGDGMAIACLPLTALRWVLVLGRDEGPSFLRSELVHAERVIALAMDLLTGTLRDRSDPLSELTSNVRLPRSRGMASTG
jgi:hypothetical protein